MRNAEFTETVCAMIIRLSLFRLHSLSYTLSLRALSVGGKLNYGVAQTWHWTRTPAATRGCSISLVLRVRSIITQSVRNKWRAAVALAGRRRCCYWIKHAPWCITPAPLNGCCLARTPDVGPMIRPFKWHTFSHYLSLSGSAASNSILAADTSTVHHSNLRSKVNDKHWFRIALSKVCEKSLMDCPDGLKKTKNALLDKKYRVTL